MQTAPDSQAGYQAYSRFCDEQLPQDRDSGRYFPPSLDDAQVYSDYTFYDKGELQPKSADNRPCQLSHRPANLDELHLNAAQSFEFSSSTFYNVDVTCSNQSPTSQLPTISFSTHPQSKYGFVRDLNQAFSLNSSSTSVSTIINIEYLRDDVKYDFEIPIYENYYAGGAIQHNSGKTTAGCILIRDVALGYHPWIDNFAKVVKKNWKTLKFPQPGWWFKERNRLEKAGFEDIDHLPYFKTAKEAYAHIKSFEDIPIRVPSMVAVCAKDFKVGVGKVFEPKLKELVPGPYKDGKYIKTIDKLQGKVAEKFIWQNGSETHFFSGEQDTFRFEGSTWDLIAWDEPPKQDHYVAMKRGTLVNDAPMFFQLTPLSEPWLHDSLIKDHNKAGSNVHITSCDLYSPEVDWMTQEAKEDFEREIFKKDPHEVEARIHGKFTHLLGRIFPTYSEEVHLLPHADVMAQTSLPVTYGVTVDPHDRRPFAIVWWFINTSGDLYFFKNYPIQLMPEVKSCDLTVEKYADMLKEVEQNLCDGNVTYRLGDPNKFKTPRKTSQHAGQTLLDDFAEFQVYFDAEINDSLHDGHSAVREVLYHDPDQPISAVNKPKIYVSDECWNINTSFMNYTWNDKKSKELASEVPHEKWKDFADCVRYTVIKNPVFIDRGSQIVYTPEVRGRLHKR